MPGDLDNAPTVENTVSLFDRETVDRLETTGFSVEGAAAPRDVVDPVDRYDLLDELARGGMGVVHLATDRTLGRPVAIKILQERYRTGSAAARRFVDEARITGQLQHPGIPPIHDLGTLPDGRPFLAMKLIKGRTLDDLLEDRAGPDVDRGRFLAAFEQVCQAVGYAHAHHVIHRDLKPQNIMIGAFGEVQVMDWGLAKVLGETSEPRISPGPAERFGTEILSARDDSDGTETQDGSVLGTPAYMAPEQAIGAVEQVDKRSDVFGLGAVLAVILTGRPPFVGNTAESTRLLAARGQVEDCFDRLAACGAEPELVELCQRCLSLDRGDRPLDAGAVASSVAAWRAEAEERARRAELDRVRAEGDRARLEAEARAHRQKRRAEFAVVAGVIGLLIVGGAAWLAVRNQAEARRGDADRLASVALGRAEQIEAEAAMSDVSEVADSASVVRLWEQAEAAVAQSEGAIAGVGDANQAAKVRVKAAAIRAGLAKARRDDALLIALEAAGGGDLGTIGNQADQRASVRQFRAAFEAAGLPAGGEPATLADAIRAERPGLRSALLTALDRWTGALQNPPDPDADRVRATANLVDADPIRKEIRSVVTGADKPTLTQLAGRLNGVDLPVTSSVMLGSAFLKNGLSKEAVGVLRKARDRDPADLMLLARLGWSLNAAYPGDPVALEESVGCARAMVAAHPGKAFSHYEMGQVFRSGKKDPAAAEPHYLKALERNPRHTFTMINLGTIRSGLGDLAGAERWYRKAIQTDPNIAMAHHLLGELMKARGDLADAEVEFRAVIDLEPNYLPERELLANVRRMAELLPRLDDVVAGRTEPASASEAAEFARLCAQPFRRQYAASTRIYDRAFATDPGLTEVPTSPIPYRAACSAALAGSGQGVDAPSDPARRVALRGQALAWLRADVARWARRAASDNPEDRNRAMAMMNAWLADDDFASVRPGSARYDLPADERTGWETLWADARATLEVARKPISSTTNP